MRKITPKTLAAALGLACVASVQAAEMVPWREHQRPWTFVFGNDIDGHQQTRQRADGSLDGFLYIRHTGVVTHDGLPVATHADCSAAGADCVVGWTIDGRPASAMLAHEPMHMHDHLLFVIGRADIPQPGAYVHFHWTGMDMPAPGAQAAGYLLQLTAVNRFCFIHHGAEAAMTEMSCRDNGGVEVERGIDTATHLNIVTTAHGGM